MKLIGISLGMGWIAMATAMGQMDIPRNPIATPTAFDTRAVGGSVDTGATVDPEKAPSPISRYVTHIVLYDYRMWTSAEGKPLQAKLIAFEDLVAEAPKGTAAPTMPTPPANPTVVRGAKVRLLVNGKPVELALDRLSRQDQEFVSGIQAALLKKASGK